MNFTPLSRFWAETPPNRVAEALEARRRGGKPFIDLANANAHENGLEFPPERLAEIAAEALRNIPSARIYKPDPRGQLPAREAVADYYRRRGIPTHPDHILLTPGTSLAYFYILRLLVNPDEEILIPRPGYPLFDDICSLCGIRMRYYQLIERNGVWGYDPDEIEFQCTSRTRAIMAVSPHNPTGAVLSREELDALGRICKRRDLTLVFDEVFSEFLDSGIPSLPRPNVDDFPLLITLNGFSKMFSLPGWKVGWMKMDGRPEHVAQFERALEHLSDTFLPVNELAQSMIPGVLEAGDPEVSAALGREIAARRNLALDSLKFSVARPQAGVYLCVSLNPGDDDEDFVIQALQEQDVFVHPGYYYDLPGYFVMTCLARPELLRDGIEQLNRRSNLER